MLAVHFPGHRAAHHARAGLEFPQLFAGFGVKCLQEAFRSAGEHQIACGAQYAAPQRGFVLVFPLDLAGFRVHGAQHADVVVIQRLDGEARAQVSGALLVGDRLVPDVHAPFVAGHVEQFGLRAVGHRHPVLAAQEGRCGKHRLALAAFSLLGRVKRVGRAAFRVDDRFLGLQVETLGPGDLGHKRVGAQQVAVGAVGHKEEAIAVSLGAGLDHLAVFFQVERDEFVHAVKVPAVMRRGLQVPLDFAVVRVDGQGGGGVQVVALAGPRVPRRRIAGAHEDGVGFRVVGAAQPGGAAALLPLVAFPGGVQRAGHGAFLAIERAHMAFDHRTRPHQLASLGVAGFHLADNAEFTAGHAGDDLALHDHRRGGVRVTGLVVAQGLGPHHLAGLAVQRHQTGVQGAEVHQVAVDGHATVDHVAARHDAVRQTGVVFPQLLAGARVHGVGARVRGGDIHHAVMDDRLGFLTALLFAAKREAPGRHQFFHRAGVQLGQRAETLALRAQAIRHHVARGFGVVENILVIHRSAGQRGAQGGGNHQGAGGQSPAIARKKCVHLSGSPLVNWASLAREKIPAL